MVRPWTNRRTLVGAGLVLVGTLFILLAILAALWVVMPDWFRQLVVNRVPSLPLAYLAAERQAPDGDLSSVLYNRFSRESILRICADRFETGSSAERAFAARHVLWNFWIRRGGAAFSLRDPVLQQRLVHGLFHLASEPDLFAKDTACAALLWIDKSHLPEVLKSLGQKTKLGNFSAGALRSITDRPEITSFLIENFSANPSRECLKAVLSQQGPAAEDLLVSVLSSSVHASFHRTLLHDSVGTPWLSSPQFVTAVRARCLDNNYDVRRTAIEVLAATANGLEAVLLLRLDPTATQAHKMADYQLQFRADELTTDQLQRLKNAPPLLAHEVD